MRVLIQQTVWAGTLMFDVWFVFDDGAARKRMVGQFEAEKGKPARMVMQEVKEGAHMEPTLRLSAQELDVFRHSLNEFGDTSTSDFSFLKDAVKTRDRLLTLVEKLALPVDLEPA